ncbi:MAG: hypothetical protein J6Y78_06180 [Paludibacteraceae bacterium]|nr:hypothetical protein [Paludibacteraceae bacterium]
MKKFFYIAIVTIILSMVANSAKANYLYLHHNVWGDEGHNYTIEVVDTIYVDFDCIDGVFYTDKTKSVSMSMFEFPIPTLEGRKFFSYRAKDEFHDGEWIEVIYFDNLFNRYVINGYYINRSTPTDLYACFVFAGDDTTAINEIDYNTSKPTEIYTLNGIKVKEITQSGIYIVNGKKTFVKR